VDANFDVFFLPSDASSNRNPFMVKKKSALSYRIVAALIVFVCGALIGHLSGCAAVNPYYDPSKPHHTEKGFKNNYSGPVSKSFFDFLKWQIRRIANDLPPAPQTPTPVVPADLAFISSNAKAGTNMQPAVTWIGHASTLVQASGLNVLTDPVFSQRASMFNSVGPIRTQAPGLSLEQLPKIDVVLISHNHFDHLDINSVIALAKQAGGSPQFIVPLGVKPWMENLGISKVHEMDWWESFMVGKVEFMLTPVQHWSARGITDRSHTLWGGWAVFGPDFQWYFTGDTGYTHDFIDTKARFSARQTQAQGGGFDLALIAVGAYEPRWFMQEQHINPAEAIQIHQELGAKRSMGVHWGTFNLTDEPLDQPPKDLAIARKAAHLEEDAFFLLAVGETRKLPVRSHP
jgi:N-acyl-phosphatidylethanolamine-hydrolysing phospholipase D